MQRRTLGLHQAAGAEPSATMPLSLIASVTVDGGSSEACSRFRTDSGSIAARTDRLPHPWHVPLSVVTARPDDPIILMMSLGS